jgi:hypothetical protein
MRLRKPWANFKAIYSRLASAIQRSFRAPHLLAICALTILFQTGPELQQYIFSIGSASKPNIYASVYGTDLIVFPTFTRWLFDWRLLIFFVISYVVYTYASYAVTAVQYAGRFILSSFVALTLYDVFILWRSGTLGQIPENVIGNTIGPTTLVILFIVLARAAELTSKRLETQKHALATAVGVLILSIAASGTVFLVARTLFEPLPSEFASVSSGDFDAIYSPHEESDGGNAPTENHGALAPAEIDGSPIEATGMEAMADWAAKEKPFRRDVVLSFYSGCAGEDRKNLPTNPTPIVLSSLSSFEIRTDSDFAEFKITTKEKYDATYNINTKASSLQIRHEDGKIDLTHSLFDNSIVKLSGIDRYSIVLTLPLVAERANGLPFVQREVRWKSSAANRSFIFGVAPNLNPRGKTACRPIVPDRSVKGVDVEMLVDVSATPLDRFAGILDDTQLRLAAKRGWFSFPELKFADFSSTRSLELARLGLYNASLVSLDGHQLQLMRPNTVGVEGQLYSSISGDGNLISKGNGDHVWVDSQRVNKTLWERVPDDWAIYVTALFLGAIGVVLRGIHKLMAGRWDIIPFSLFNNSRSAG